MSQKNEEKSSRPKYHNVTSSKIDAIGKYYYILQEEFNKKQQHQ